jgi:hypothetical protein
MNSVIEAKQDFTMCFGPLTLRHMAEGVVLPHFSEEQIEMDKFIDDHQKDAPVKIPLKVIDMDSSKMYAPTKWYYD